MRYSLSKRDIAVIPPHAIGRTVIKNPEHYKRIVVNISQHLMSDFEYSSLKMKENWVHQKTQGSRVLHLDAENFQQIISLFDQISEKIENGKENYSFTLQYLLFQVLQIIFDPSSSNLDLSKKRVLDQRLASILEYIEVHLVDTDLSLENVSDYFHLNKFHFSHYFKKKMNLPFYRYVLLKRLSLALVMIKQNQLTIEQIALKCGYNDYSSFYRSFKKEYKISPKKLQKEYVNNFKGN